MAVFLNRIATATPRHEVHDAFRAFARRQAGGDRERAAFDRLADRSRILRRWSVLKPPDPPGSGTTCGFYRAGGAFPSTRTRMARYEAEAPALAAAAVERLGLGAGAAGITHLVFATCTGFAAPGPEHAVIARFGLRPDIERTTIGFMGCQAALNALKAAWHIVRSEPGARVLVLTLELCTLHLQDSAAMEQLMCFLLFGDGCAAALVSAEPEGLRLDGFGALLLPGAADQITWRIGDDGFDMTLSGMVPFTLAHALPDWRAALPPSDEVDLWAVHPGGRAILDAAAHGLGIARDALAPSDAVLEGHGNMSSCTVLFVLRDLMAAARRGQRGVALAFGPGLSVESLRFEVA